MTARPALLTTFGDDVRHHLTLTPRQLPSQYLYDQLGSALFDAICELPWYGITRAESRLLSDHRIEIFEQLPELTRIVELGPGDGRKLQTLVAGTSRPLTAHLIDVSASALDRAAHAVSDAGHVRVVAHEASFEDGLEQIRRLPADGDSLVLFLGSNIGNFAPPDARVLLQQVRTSLAGGGTLLIGADLVKAEGRLVLAYDDPLGVSAAFNLNMLLRINRDLGGDFDVTAFRHRAVWNARGSRMEMFLVSRKPQHVRIAAVDLDIDFEQGEAIWTESSYKYTPDSLNRLLLDAGFRLVEQWIDREEGFALSLARAS